MAILQVRDCEHRQKARCEIMRGRVLGINYMESVREREKSRKLPRFLDQNLVDDNSIYQDIKNKCRRFERTHILKSHSVIVPEESAERSVIENELATLP